MYEYKTKPYEHQVSAFERSWDKPYWALLMEMGTGKSKVTVDTIAALFENKRIDTALIIAPKGVFDNWVRTEIPVHLPDRIPHKILRWQPNITKKYQEDCATSLCPSAGSGTCCTSL